MMISTGWLSMSRSSHDAPKPPASPSAAAPSTSRNSVVDTSSTENSVAPLARPTRVRKATTAVPSLNSDSQAILASRLAGAPVFFSTLSTAMGSVVVARAVGLAVYSSM